VITLSPMTLGLAAAVLAHQPIEEPHAGDWPHDDTYDALGMFQGGPGTFAILEDGVIVGDCGWFGPADEDGEVEIGYGLAASARGRGLGTQAVQLLVDWVRTEGGARTVRAEVLPGNEPSLRLLARLGFEDTGERAGHRILVL